MVRGRIADLLAWEQVESELREEAKKGSVDAQRMQRLTVEMEKAKKIVPDAIRQAWCMMVTVSETNDVQAFKLGITDESLFITLKGDPRSRLQETKITAESLLPDGPYDLWKAGETLRRSSVCLGRSMLMKLGIGLSPGLRSAMLTPPPFVHDEDRRAHV